MENHLRNRLPIPHTFVTHTYTKPTKCQLCHKVETNIMKCQCLSRNVLQLLVGVYKQGLQCKDCEYNVHKKCSDRAARDCTGEITAETAEDGGQDSEADTELAGGGGEESLEDCVVTLDTLDQHLAAQQAGSQTNVPLQRLVQSVRQVTISCDK